jgi:hypothetical protein
MDFDRLSRIFARMMDENGLLYSTGGIAVLALLVLVIALRIRKSKRAKLASQAQSAPVSKELAPKALRSKAVIDDDIEMTIKLEETPTAEGVVAFELDTSAPQAPDMHIGEGMDGVDDLDDITIPKIGQAPPPQKSRFFSAAWLNKETKTAPASGLADAAQMSDAPAPEDSQMRAAASECARLAEIERKLMALRELYEAGLIAPEVYVLKAREFAAQVD